MEQYMIKGGGKGVSRPVACTASQHYSKTLLAIHCSLQQCMLHSTLQWIGKRHTSPNKRHDFMTMHTNHQTARIMLDTANDGVDRH